MILPLEKQVTNLEISKRMDELGFSYYTLWYWVEDEMDEWCVVTENLLYDNYGNIKYEGEKYSAFPVAELGMLLPVGINYLPEGEWYDLWIIKQGNNKEFIVAYTREPGRKTLQVFKGAEANARGLMAIYLKEKGLI